MKLPIPCLYMEQNFSPLFPTQQLQASSVNIKHLFYVNYFPLILGRNIRFKLSNPQDFRDTLLTFAAYVARISCLNL